ncbi:hypothetical protein EC973_002737 [Apophysomyces ossiformis]|uniref:Ricin B lectin domain-containing protein n=1 Tax=Apophysomyces ossiformis TaxID=679940 RepID=A0A8H7BXH9_9FUNG|nr:hypothetical protein EC973_002737 [Apophysomyces ossiformis]
MFPPGYFYILSNKHGFALDVYDGQTKEDANIIVWPQKFQDSDNQLWTFDNGRIVNKKSGHVLDIRSSAFKKDKVIVQNKRKESSQSQEWIYDRGSICSKVYPSMVLDIKVDYEEGDSEKGGAQVLLYKRKDTDNMNQLWYFEPYHQFEHALNMATTSIPLHKKESFGQPRLGYGAEVGVPPELTKLPDNIKVVGVGSNVDTTPSPAQAPISGYSAPSHTQPGLQPQAAHPLPSQSVPTSSYPPPLPKPQQSPIVNSGPTLGYPPAPSPNSSTGYSNVAGYPPVQLPNPSPGYGSTAGYPPPPPSQYPTGYDYPSSSPQPAGMHTQSFPGEGYPPAPQPGYPPQQQHVGGFYRPPQPQQPNIPPMSMPGSGPAQGTHGYGSYPPPTQSPSGSYHSGYPPPSY